jgi:hypothetical protein
MNGVMAGSAYPATAPQGILERVRVDDVKVMSREDIVKGENTPQRFGFDGGWNFYDDAFGKPNGWFEFHIKDDFVSRVDTGLLHELTHQIGIIDMYCIVVSPHWNHVRDEDGDPVMIGYHTKRPHPPSPSPRVGRGQGGEVGGGGPAVDFDGTVMPALCFTADANGNVKVGPQGTFAAYSEETAGALNALRGLRRGHFGLYRFDLPAQSFVQVLDNTGQPVETPWFTATAVDAQGRESGYAKNKELVRWGPWGNAKVERSDPQSVSVTLLPGASWVQVRNAFVVRRNTRLKLQFQTESRRAATFRFAVAGIGGLEYLLDTDPEPKPNTIPCRRAGDGWLEVDISLRELFDKAAASKKVTPAPAMRGICGRTLFLRSREENC